MFERNGDAEAVIREYMRKFPKLSSTDADQVLYSLYETTFGLFNHRNKDTAKNRPLSTVAMHEGEETAYASGIAGAIQAIVDSSIVQHTGLNMLQMLELPREIYNLTLKAVANKVARANKETENLERKTQKLFDQG